jgi:hydrogenase maturation factor HypF (carbamoyltransferase family)
MGALMDRSTEPSTGTCPQCQGRGYTFEHIPNTYGYLKVPCPHCGPRFTFTIPLENTFSATVELIPDDE